MRIFLPMQKSSAKISLLLIAMAMTSCNSLKRVDDDEFLIKQNTIWADSVKVVSEDIENLIIQEPNSDLLGYPLRLNLYNLAKPNPDSLYQNWLYKKPKRKQRLTKFLSEKQVNRLGESFIVKGYSEWLKKLGEAPVILDTTQTRRTLERLKAYYSTKGYFNNTTNYNIDFLKQKQRVAVHYNIDLGDPYMLDSVSHKIASIAIDSIYNLVKIDSYVKAGQQFDLENFNNERERLTAIFRNNGVWNFQESSIKYDVISDTTKAGDDRLMDIELNIDNLKKRDENSVTSSEYKVFKFDKINVYTDYLSDEDESDGELKFERFGNYTVFYKDKLRFKPKTLTNAIFFSKDSVYRDINRIRTLRQITSLNVFKYPSLTFAADSTQNNLTANIYLATKPKYTFAPNFEITRSNIRKVGIGFGASLLIRNVFKGAENLSFSASGSFGLLSQETSTEDTFSEIGADANLGFPRIWLPLINTDKLIPNYMMPQTNLSFGTSFQKNIGLDKQTLNTILGYNWSPSEYTKNNIELLNIEYVRNTNEDRFFNVYRNTYNRLNAVASTDEFRNNPDLKNAYDNDGSLTIPDGTNQFMESILLGSTPATRVQFNEVLSIAERSVRLTNNNLIFASNFTFNKNNRKGPTDNRFYQFRFKLETAGNLFSLLSNVITLDKNDENRRLIVNVPYDQYVKGEFDYVKYWDLSQSRVLAFRSFFGIAIPYGNSDNIPFVRSYFAGGANDNRAWRPYSLGPGRTGGIFDFNEANLKIALNFEYRFPIAGNFKGALFADAGNIWNVFDNVDDPEATFNGLKSLKDIALGSGFGIRYDFTYFVLRGDLGFKTYNPAEESSKRWFRDFNFANSVLQIGINYPF